MKKILGLSIAAVLVMALVAIGTWSYFSDTETSNNNQITAGTLDLKINNGDVDYKILDPTVDVTLANKSPGDTGANFAPLKNAGTLAGLFSMSSSPITNIGATIGTGEFADGVGNLGADSQIAPWIDVNANGTFDTGDWALKSDGTVQAFSAGLQWGTWNSFASKTWNPVINSMAPNAIVNFYINWRIDATDTNVNEIQGDTVKLSFSFYLDQIH